MTSFRSQFFVTASSRESSESIPLLETRNALKIMNYNLLLAYRGVPRKRASPPSAKCKPIKNSRIIVEPCTWCTPTFLEQS